MRGTIKLLVLVVLAGIAWRYAALYGGAAQALHLAGVLLWGEWIALPEPFATIAITLVWLVALGIALGVLVVLLRLGFWVVREIREALD